MSPLVGIFCSSSKAKIPKRDSPLAKQTKANVAPALPDITMHVIYMDTQGVHASKGPYAFPAIGNKYLEPFPQSLVKERDNESEHGTQI